MVSEDDRAWVILCVACAMRLVCLGETPNHPPPPFISTLLSVAKLCLTTMAPWMAAHKVPLPSTISQRLLKLMYIVSVMLSTHLN